MPEGNVVHYHARRLRRAFGRRPVLLDSPQGRFRDEAGRLDGAVLLSAEAYGKHLLLRFPDERWVHVHLGLFGTWRIGRGEAPAPVGQIRLRLRGVTHYAELRGPTACEILDENERAALLGRIGPDPIRPDADPLQAWHRVERSRQPIASLLMDQRVFAGVGNIYRAEVLFRQNVSPFRSGQDLRWPVFQDIWSDLVDLMTRGTARGRIATVRPEDTPTVRERGTSRNRYDARSYVYRREGQACYLCDETVEGMVMQGRRLYWCPCCQSS